MFNFIVLSLNFIFIHNYKLPLSNEQLSILLFFNWNEWVFNVIVEVVVYFSEVKGTIFNIEIWSIVCSRLFIIIFNDSKVSLYFLFGDSDAL